MASMSSRALAAFVLQMRTGAAKARGYIQKSLKFIVRNFFGFCLKSYNSF